MLRRAHPHRSNGTPAGGSSVVVISLNGLVQNAARNSFYVQKSSIEQTLNTSDDELLRLLYYGYITWRRMVPVILVIER